MDLIEADSSDSDDDFFDGEDSDGTSSDSAEDPEPIDFDVAESTNHTYLFEHDDNPGEISNSPWLEPNKSHIVPLIDFNIVVLPGQILPIHTGEPTARKAIQKAIKDNSYVALRTVFGEDADQLPRLSETGTLIQIIKFADDGIFMKVNTVGRQRCRFISVNSQINGLLLANIEVLSESLLPPFTSAFCPSPSPFVALTERKKLQICNAIVSFPSFVASVSSTEKLCEDLSNWMKMWYSDDRIKCSLNLGPIQFSYWVATHLPVSLLAKYQFLEEDSTDLRIHQLHNSIKMLTSLACNSCGSVIASMDNVVNMSTEGTISHFVNEGGYIHEMITVSRAENFLRKDRPVSNYSWFSGYKWQIIECSNCANHLGWEFTSKQYLPAVFLGISRRSVRPRLPSDATINSISI